MRDLPLATNHREDGCDTREDREDIMKMKIFYTNIGRLDLLLSND
jgi:hypothetical protein